MVYEGSSLWEMEITAIHVQTLTQITDQKLFILQIMRLNQ